MKIKSLNTKRYAGLVLLTILFSYLSLGPLFVTRAQENTGDEDSTETRYGIVVTPALEFLDLTRSEEYNGSVTLTNDLETRQAVTLYPRALVFTEDETSPGAPKFLFDNDRPVASDISSWVTFNSNRYDIAPDSSVTVGYSINVPFDAEPGGHYLALVFQENNEEILNEININKAITTLVFVTVGGDVVQNGELLDFKSGQTLYAFTPVDLIITYRNLGNVHDVIGGDIFIHRGDITDPIAQFEINSTGRISFPGSTRDFTETFTSGFIQVDSSGNIIIDKNEFPSLPFGQYTATLKLRHTVDNVRETITRDINFWVIPWPVILSFAIVVLLLVIYIYNKQNGTVKYVKKSKYNTSHK